MLLRAFPHARHLKFADPLRKAIPAMFGLSHAAWEDLYLTDKKEQPTDMLCGHSPRSAMIWLSEEVMKPTYGINIFGHLAVNQLRDMAADVIFSDCGFTHELEPLEEHLGSRNMLIVRLHRPGKTFAGDSRGYIVATAIPTIDIHNDSHLDRLEELLVGAVDYWLQTGETA
jgi:hypothetical protein